MRKTEPIPREHRPEPLQAAVKGAGVKLTHQRLEIIRILAATEEHPDAEAVFEAVKRRVPTISLDTVYRTLWMLHDLGLVRTLGPRRGRLRFDANLDAHHHYVCVRCGLVRDFSSTELNDLRVPDAVRHFGSVVDAQVEVRGLCARCQRSRKTGPSRGRARHKARHGASERSTP